jgi:hypothetical protein
LSVDIGIGRFLLLGYGESNISQGLKVTTQKEGRDEVTKEVMASNLDDVKVALADSRFVGKE